MAKRITDRKKAYIENVTPKKTILEKLGKRIKTARKDAGFTSAEHFSYDLEISRPMYSAYENGNDMRVSTLFKIIEGMGMTIPEFFAKFDDPEKV